MSDKVRVILLVVAVVLGLGVAAVPVVISLIGGSDSGSGITTSDGAGESADRSADGTESTAATGAATNTGTPTESYRIAPAQRIACPAGDAAGTNGGNTTGSELADVSLPCLSDGGQAAQTSLAAALAGKPTLVNVWAWWCQPCRAELPILQEASRRHPEWNIVGVHDNAQGQAGIDLLADLDVQFPSFQDSTSAFAAAASLPSVIPVSVIYRADGTRAAFHPGEITSVDELETIMAPAL